MEKSEEVRGGWVANATRALNLWRDPIVAANSRTSDFRLRDIQYGKHQVSVYLVIPPGDLKRLSPLVRLFFQQLTDALTEQLKDEHLGDEVESRHRLLMLMDEFPQFGNMSKIESAISYTAGYDIRWFFICQGLPQLDRIYGRDNSILANCHTRLAYRCNDDKNAKRLSQLLGKATAVKEQEGESGKKSVLSSMDKRSLSHVQYARDLMTPGELQQLDEERVVIMTAGKPPVLGHKLRYYEHSEFTNRYRGKILKLPMKPLDDFPPRTGTSAWEPEEPRPEASEVQKNMDVAKDEEVEEVDPSRDSPPKESPGERSRPTGVTYKAEYEAIQGKEALVPEGMNSEEAAIHLTTRGVNEEFVKEAIRKGIRNGTFSEGALEHFQHFLRKNESDQNKAIEHPEKDSQFLDMMGYEAEESSDLAEPVERPHKDMIHDFEDSVEETGGFVPDFATRQKEAEQTSDVTMTETVALSEEKLEQIKAERKAPLTRVDLPHKTP